MHFFFRFSAFPSIVSSTHTTFSYKYVLIYFPPSFLLYLLSSAQITFHLSFCTFVPKIISFCTSFPFVFHTNSYIFSFKYLYLFFLLCFLAAFFFLLCRFPKVLILYIPQCFPYILISKHTVMAINIGTVGKYNQRKLWKLICIVNPFDLFDHKSNLSLDNKNFKWGKISLCNTFCFSNTCWTQLLVPLEILMSKISLK